MTVSMARIVLGSAYVRMELYVIMWLEIAAANLDGWEPTAIFV